MSKAAEQGRGAATQRGEAGRSVDPRDGRPRSEPQASEGRAPA